MVHGFLVSERPIPKFTCSCERVFEYVNPEEMERIYPSAPLLPSLCRQIRLVRVAQTAMLNHAPLAPQTASSCANVDVPTLRVCASARRSSTT